MVERRSILLTGFGPFPGVPVNASGDLALELAAEARKRFSGYRTVAEVLPTEWKTAPARLTALLQETRPALALHFGVSRAAKGFVIETEARNVAGALPDACGALPGARCVVENGSARLSATLPAERIVANLRAAGMPASSSRDAGKYLCNAVLYHSLWHAAASQGQPMVGFVHIPAGRYHRFLPGLVDWDRAVSGGLAIIATCLEPSSRTLERDLGARLSGLRG